MKRCTTLFIYAILAVLAIFVFAGCKNPILIEMFGDNVITDIAITNNSGQQISATFNPNIMTYEYTIDSTVQIKLTLNHDTSVHWGYNNFTNPYKGKIVVPAPQSEDKQLFITATERHGKAKVYVITFSRNPTNMGPSSGTSDNTSVGIRWYVAATTGNDTYSGTADEPFKTLGRAVQAVKDSVATVGYTGAQIIYISGTLNYASESTTTVKDADSVFYINGLNNTGTPTPITLIGQNGATLTNGAGGTDGKRRTLKIENSIVTIKSTVIESNTATDKDGGAIYIGTNATVTIANGAVVNGRGTSLHGNGIYVGGILSFAGSGVVSGGDVYLPQGRSIQIADGLTANPVAVITTQATPAENKPIRVLDGSSSLVSAHFYRFSARNNQHTITAAGMLELTGAYYVKSGGIGNGSSAINALGALREAVYLANVTTIKTIYVLGTLTDTSEWEMDNDNVFTIDNTSGAQITIKGINGINGILSAAGTTKRAVKVPYNSGPVKFESIRITGANTTNNGGGMLVETAVEFGDNVEISGNTVSNNIGGGVFISGVGTLTISGSNVRITNNTVSNNAPTGGGGVYIDNGGSLTISGSNTRISNNTVSSNGVASGGGVHNGGTFTISGNNASISYNTANGTVGVGGGVYNHDYKTLNISGSNTSISYNMAIGTAIGTGGGLWNNGNGINVSSVVTVNNNIGSHECGGLSGVSSASDPAKWKYGTGGAANSPSNY